MSQFVLSQPPKATDDYRYAEVRASYLERAVGLPSKLGRALAYSELGYSSSGIAKRCDVTEGTARGWLEQVENEYGWRALMPRPQNDPVEALE